jgi:proprotein convertase subtilisin/kexin type 2
MNSTGTHADIPCAGTRAESTKSFTAKNSPRRSAVESQKKPRGTTLGRLVVFVGSLCLYSCSGGGGGGQQGSTSPSTPTPPGISTGDQELLLTWNMSSELTYSLYFDTASPVDPATATRLAGVQSPFLHTGLVNGTTYSYVLTASSFAEESDPSAEVSGSPQSGASSPDPLLAQQWHLQNDGQTGGLAGADANVSPVWSAGIAGNGVRIAIVDDGLEIGHPDLVGNVVPGGSIDYADGDNDPTGGSHGTSVGGVSAAVGGNGLGVSGAAPRAELVGYNYLANPTAATEADAMSRDAASNWISNNSWGPVNGNDPTVAPSSWFDAVGFGLENGRNGLGTIYLFAAGNSGHTGANTNYSEYTIHPGVITVGAIDHNDRAAFYSTPGANILVCAHTQGEQNTPGITTTDRSGTEGYNTGVNAQDYANLDFTNTFNGTSSATPLTSGVVALLLEANPNLGWREVRRIVALSARKNDPFDSGWSTNGAGYPVHHTYGYGCVDATAALNLASQTSPLPPMQYFEGPFSQPNLAIPDADAQGVEDFITVSGSGIEDTEHVYVVFSAADHTYIGDLQIELTSPDGNTVSVLAEPHELQAPGTSTYSNWYFGTARHMDERADGVWKLRVIDAVSQDTGTFQSWGLIFLGH